MIPTKQSPANTESVLAVLRQRFDQRLAVLQTPDVGDRLRAIMCVPAKLESKVKVGASH
jgi:hypothetical protein